MRKTTIAVLATLTLGATQAAYTVKLPLQTDKGGTLPSGSIQIRSTATEVPEAPEPTPENWQSYDPEYSAWVNSGAIYSCTNWTPDPSTVTAGQTFNQTATDCQQDQSRSRQDREQETTTKVIRNKDTAVTETQTITVSSTRNATGTKITKECLYDFGGKYKVLLNFDNKHYYAFNSVQIGTTANSVTQLIYNSKKYTRGALMYTTNFYGTEQHYEICVEDI